MVELSRYHDRESTTDELWFRVDRDVYFRKRGAEGDRTANIVESI